jgi:hypothetical protein
MWAKEGIMQISKLTFVGSVEEFVTVAHLFDEAPRRTERRHRPPQPQATPEELIGQVLSRMPIPPAQRALYQALYRAGDAGLGATELAEAIRRTEPQLAGVLGALGRRTNRTPGVDPDNLPGVGLMFDITERDGQWHYRMRDETREVLEALRPSWLQPQA